MARSPFPVGPLPAGECPAVALGPSSRQKPGYLTSQVGVWLSRRELSERWRIVCICSAFTFSKSRFYIAVKTQNALPEPPGDRKKLLFDTAEYLGYMAQGIAPRKRARDSSNTKPALGLTTN